MDKILSTKTFLISLGTILILALIFLGGLYFYLNKDNERFNLTSYIPVTSKPLSLSLEINNPEDELLTFDKSITVSGQTLSKAQVIISNVGQTQESNTGLETKASGDFSTVINLHSGINNITVTVFDKEGNSKTDSRLIFYSEEKLP